jgi:hypothetical protein
VSSFWECEVKGQWRICGYFLRICGCCFKISVFGIVKDAFKVFCGKFLGILGTIFVKRYFLKKSVIFFFVKPEFFPQEFNFRIFFSEIQFLQVFFQKFIFYKLFFSGKT